MKNHSPQWDPEHALERFRERARAAGLVLTHQREILFRAIVSSKSHPSPETLYAQVKREIPSISLATVYKNIKTFVEAGLMREVSLHHGTLRLEANLEPHHHLICTRCRTIIDVEESGVDPVHLRHRPPAGFRVDRYSVEFHGLCAACAKSST